MSTLVDTSVWVDHLRRGNAQLATLLDAGAVCCHPFVIGELACGTLRNREEVLRLLRALPEAPVAAHEEALSFVSDRHLHGRGLGWIDLHLLASALIGHCRLWTLDKALAAAAVGLKIPT
jgi:predicted nucleic acid-binding protein